MQSGKSGMGMGKHRKSGMPHNSQHFTGKKGGMRATRKGKGLARKKRKANRGTHVNKYKVP
jgi:hypothetical protein